MTMTAHNPRPKEFELTPKHEEQIKQSICKGATDDELMFFLHTCKYLKLDPFAKQIHSIPRQTRQGEKWVTVRSIQVSIDGLRLIAERTQRYMPGPKTTFTYTQDGQIQIATAYIKKMDASGQWHIIEADAYWCEYVQTKKDGAPQSLWATKPHVMLGKCAEAIALRRAFPAEMSGAYTQEEMAAAYPNDNSDLKEPEPTLTFEQQEEIATKADEKLQEHIVKSFNVLQLSQIPQKFYNSCIKRIDEIMDQRQAAYTTEGAL